MVLGWKVVWWVGGPVLTWLRGRQQKAAACCAGRCPCIVAHGRLRHSLGWLAEKLPQHRSSISAVGKGGGTEPGTTLQSHHPSSVGGSGGSLVQVQAEEPLEVQGGGPE